jgi:hypothetical protein
MAIYLEPETGIILDAAVTLSLFPGDAHRLGQSPKDVTIFKR